MKQISPQTLENFTKISINTQGKKEDAKLILLESVTSIQEIQEKNLIISEQLNPSPEIQFKKNLPIEKIADSQEVISTSEIPSERNSEALSSKNNEITIVSNSNTNSTCFSAKNSENPSFKKDEYYGLQKIPPRSERNNSQSTTTDNSSKMESRKQSGELVCEKVESKQSVKDKKVPEGSEDLYEDCENLIEEADQENAKEKNIAPPNQGEKFEEEVKEEICSMIEELQNIVVICV